MTDKISTDYTDKKLKTRTDHRIEIFAWKLDVLLVSRVCNLLFLKFRNLIF